jgi:uncharacterized protein YcaQ
MAKREPTIEDLRITAVRRSLFTPLSLPAAIERLGYVQADPIRAPARAQDLILRHRARGYRDGDLERRYHKVGAEEDVLHNYGFVPRSAQAWLHPRVGIRWRRSQPALEEQVLAFMAGRGPTHPREVDAHFGIGAVATVWGSKSSKTTRALDHLHYRGQLRVAGRQQGIRLYETASHLHAVYASPLSAQHQLEGAALTLLRLYAPLPVSSWRQLVTMLRYGAPQLVPHLRKFPELLVRLREQELIREARVEGVDYAWPANERLGGVEPPRQVRLLAPFDPVVWDRRRFTHLWGWQYRFEAYIPPAKRRLGYYALPILWGHEVVGWANAKAEAGSDKLEVEAGLATLKGRPRDFKRELETEIESLREFLGVGKVGKLRWLA